MKSSELETICAKYSVPCISVDFLNDSYNCVRSKQSDNTRYVLCTLTENGIVRTIKSGEQPKIRMKKPDNTYIYNDCEIITDNSGKQNDGRILIHFTDQMLVVRGNAVCDIQLVSGNTSYSSLNFIVHISPLPFDENAVKSTNEFKTLVQLIADVEQATENANEAENVRKQNEAVREANEAAREQKIEEFEEYLSDTENIVTQKANAAANSASTAAQEAEEASASAAAANASETAAANSASTATSKATAASTSANNAATSATNADAYAKQSQSYAVGGTGTRPGEDTDNAKYYAEQAEYHAEQAKENAESEADRAKTEADRAKAEADRVSSVTGGSGETDIPLATTTNDGLMSKEDKQLLEGIDNYIDERVQEGVNDVSGYTLPAATALQLGGIKIGSTVNQSEKKYPVQLDNWQRAYVEVPWSSGGSGGTDTYVHAYGGGDTYKVLGALNLNDTDITLTLEEDIDVMTVLFIEFSYYFKSGSMETSPMTHVMTCYWSGGNIGTSVSAVYPDNKNGGMASANVVVEINGTTLKILASESTVTGLGWDNSMGLHKIDTSMYIKVDYAFGLK